MRHKRMVWQIISYKSRKVAKNHYTNFACKQGTGALSSTPSALKSTCFVQGRGGGYRISAILPPASCSYGHHVSAVITTSHFGSTFQ